MTLQERANEALAPLHALFPTDEARRAALTQAKFELQTILTEAPTFGRAVYFLGVVHSTLGESELAVEQYKKVLNMDPAPHLAAEIYYNLGAALVDLGQPGADKAFELATLLTTDPELAKLAHIELAKIKP